MLTSALRASARRLRRSPASRGATELLRAWPASSSRGGGGCACCSGPCVCPGCAACGRPTTSARPASTSAAAPSASTSESALVAKLQAAFPGASATVTDTSGGCGTMFKISVASPAFKGVPLPRQHQAVAAALAADIPHWHGFTLDTKAA